MIYKNNLKLNFLYITFFIVSLAWAEMTPLSNIKKRELPFKIDGNLETNLGIAAPDEVFYQSSKLSLHGSADYERFSSEVLLELTNKNVLNGKMSYFRKGSLFERALSVDSVSNGLDSTDTLENAIKELIKDSTLVKMIDVAKSSYIPKLSIVLDRANIKYKGKMFNVTVGNQLIAWGSGYAWNPTDVINKKNPLDPMSPPKGVGALALDFAPFDQLVFSTVVVPSNRIEEWTEAIRLKYFGKRIDISLSTAFIGGKVRRLLDEENKQRKIIGLDLNWITKRSGNWWIESVVDLSKVEGEYGLGNIQQVIGYQREVGDKVRCFAEMYTNLMGSFEPITNVEELQGQLPYIAAGDMAGIYALYGGLGVIYNVNNNLELKTASIINGIDKSGGLMPMVQWYPHKKFKLAVTSNLFWGNKRKTEFGSFKHKVESSVVYLF